MVKADKIALIVLVAISSYYFCFCVVLAPLYLASNSAWTTRLGAFVLTAWVCRIVWNACDTYAATRRSSAIVGAAIVGSVVFIASFFSTLLVTGPYNNGNAPLGALFIYGPGGAVFGAGLGAWYWSRQRREQQ